MALTNERRLEIGYAALKNRIRRDFSFHDLNPENMKRGLGNTLKEKEFVEIGLTKEEAYEFVESLLREVFEGQMSQFK